MKRIMISLLMITGAGLAISLGSNALGFRPLSYEGNAPNTSS
jgi:hypothetical protein